MPDLHVRLIQPAPQEVTADPALLADFIDAWEVAKVAYAEVLRAGVHRSDKELAQDDFYRQLLGAGMRIHRLGGGDAVRVVSTCLGRCHQQDSARHFQRLWNGLLPETAH